MKPKTRLLKLQQSAAQAQRSLDLLEQQISFYTFVPHQARRTLELYQCYLRDLQQELQDFVP